MPKLRCKLFGCAERPDAPICGHCEAEAPFQSGDLVPRDKDSFVDLKDAWLGWLIRLRFSIKHRRTYYSFSVVPRCAHCEKNLIFRRKRQAGWTGGWFCSEKCVNGYVPF